MSQFAHGIRSFDAASMAALPPPAPTTTTATDDDDGAASTSPTTYVLGIEHRTAPSLLGHLQSIIWLTYRKDFAQLAPYEFTSDAGWGCMLRSAQMLLCEALLRNLPIYQDRRFHWRDAADGTAAFPPSVIKVLRAFVDAPQPHCHFGLHQMVSIGMNYDMLPGEWYGPTTAAQVLRDLVNAHAATAGLDPSVETMCMYVPQDGVIYTDDVRKLAITSLVDPAAAPSTDANGGGSAFFDPLYNPPQIDADAEWTRSVLILVPLRLGLDKINASYIPALTHFFSFPQSVGIIGGKRGHSVYFVGARGHQFHILDPHTVHPTPEIDASFPSATHARTIHSTDHLVMEVDYIDPSLALGFFCKTRADYVDLEARLRALAGAHLCPVSIAAARPDYGQDASELHSVSGDSANGEQDDEDDYVLI
ncbi:Aste57867_13419 [Aphanomyces stellatus]|uniref:Cysteine protease n=1 Tax=Aphanomyces stellatus TaxID=120398 RepID=A0A485KZS4_9STRA|nr:hypothetical protein As57867_013369 [Aphanomyces stellatus]VFT90258.1 Aste57867_13419 [Aphanomyces stellatus]